jgi:hypothetical protein
VAIRRFVTAFAVTLLAASGLTGLPQMMGPRLVEKWF